MFNQMKYSSHGKIYTVSGKSSCTEYSQKDLSNSISLK